jgi:hypothetical protein
LKLVASSSKVIKHTSSRKRNGKIKRNAKSPNYRALNIKQDNNRQVISTPLRKKTASLTVSAGQSDSPILPFGQILNTPTDKENFRF